MEIKLNKLQLKELKELNFFTNKSIKGYENILYNNTLKQFEITDGNVAIVVKHEIEKLKSQYYKVYLNNNKILFNKYYEKSKLNYNKGLFNNSKNTLPFEPLKDVNRLFNIFMYSNCGSMHEKQMEIANVLTLSTESLKLKECNYFLENSCYQFNILYLYHFPLGSYNHFVPTEYTKYWDNLMFNWTYFKSNINLGEIKIIVKTSKH